MHYRGFTIRHETEVDDPYCYAEGEDFYLLVDYSDAWFKPQLDQREPTLTEVSEEAETKLRLLIDAYRVDRDFLERLPAEWREGYRFSSVSVAELKEALSQVIPAPGQLPLLVQYG